LFNISKSKFRPSEIGFGKNQLSYNFDKKNDRKFMVNKRDKEEEYEEEYQKIKQNLFSCISSHNEGED
jgi:hypothetical protein